MERSLSISNRPESGAGSGKKEINTRDLETLCRVVLRCTRPIYTSINPRARETTLWTMAAAFLVFADGWLNVQFSQAERDFVNAMNDKDEAGFWSSILWFAQLLCFGAGVYSVSKYSKQRVAQEWRSAMTMYLTDKYFDHSAFYHVSSLHPEIDSPGQRIVDDIRDWCGESISLLATLLDKIVDVFSFFIVLYNISPGLVLFAVLYCGVATGLSSVLFAKRLRALQLEAAKAEAALRRLFVCIEEHREEITFYAMTVDGAASREKAEVRSSYAKLDDVVSDELRLDSYVEAFRQAFAHLTVLVPYISTASDYFSGRLSFGEVTQTGIAFYHIRSGLGVTVSRLTHISSVASHLERISTLLDGLERSSASVAGCVVEERQGYGADVARNTEEGKVSTLPTQDLLEVSALSLRIGKRQLVADLSFTVARGMNVLVLGPSGCGKTSIFRAICGLMVGGGGLVCRPDKLFVLPQKLYTPMGDLRTQLWYPYQCPDDAPKDWTLVDLLHKVGLEGLPGRTGGWDTACDFGTILSPGEQQRLGFVRMLRARPRVALLDEATSSLDEEAEAHLYSMLRKTVPSYISIGHRSTLLNYHTHVIFPSSVDAQWRFMTMEAYRKFAGK